MTTDPTELPPPKPGDYFEHADLDLDEPADYDPIPELSQRVEYYPAPATDGGRLVVQGLALTVTAIIWVFVVIKLAQLHNHVEEITNRIFDSPSAVQISQVANQATVEGTAYIGMGLGVTSVAVLVTIIFRR